MLQRSVLKKAYILSSRQLSNRRERITADPVFRVREVFHVRAKLSNIGLEMDEADERAGNKIVAPVHVLWGAKNSVGQLWDVLATWRAKAASTVTGRSRLRPFSPRRTSRGNLRGTAALLRHS